MVIFLFYHEVISLSKIHIRTQIPLNFCQHKMTKIKIPLQILLNSYGMIIILQFFATMKISHRDHRKLQKICSTKKLLPYATTYIYSTKKGVFSVFIIIMSYCDSKCSKLSHFSLGLSKTLCLQTAPTEIIWVLMKDLT